MLIDPNKQFSRVTAIGSNGELIPNAGRYSRGAIVVAFEMMGGMENFAQWAQDNEGDFYTKLFTKLVGRETEQKADESLEDMLEVLDGEIVEEPAEDAPAQKVSKALTSYVLPPLATRMADAARTYAENESLVPA